MKSLPEIRLSVKNAPEEIIKLLRVIKPAWSEDQIELKKLSGGFSCLMYMCFNKGDPEDGVTVRARTNTFEGFPHVRESAFEASVIQTMHDHGLFTEILATFQNGYCYTYIQGSPIFTYLMPEFSLDESTARLMARTLAEIHSTKVEGCDYTTTRYFRDIYAILEEKYPAADKLAPHCPQKEELQRELKIVEECALKMGSPLVLCHGDPHPGNVLFNKDKGLVTYVDWELAHVGYQAADVAYALHILKLIGMNPATKLQLPENLETKYIRFYLEKWYEIQGKKDSDVTDEEVDKLKLQASVFKLSVQLFWVAILTAQITVGLPDHLDEKSFEEAFETARKAKAEATPDTTDGNTDDKPTDGKIDDTTTDGKTDDTTTDGKTDDKTGPEHHMFKMVNDIYATYQSMKDEILANASKS